MAYLAQKQINLRGQKSSRPPHSRQIWNQLSHIFKFLYITQLSYKRIFHFYRLSAINVCHDSFIRVKGLIQSYVYVTTCRVATSPVTYTMYVHDRLTWLIHMCDMTHSCVWKHWFYHSIIFVTWLIHTCVFSHVWMSHVTHMNESCHTYEWVMSHTWMSHVTHMNESYHTCEW